MRAGMLSGAAALVLAGTGVLAANWTTAGPVAAPARGAAPYSGAPSRSMGAVSPTATAGDRYAHNVTAGAACSPLGASGFTAQVRLLRCATTSTDPHPRWRAP